MKNLILGIGNPLLCDDAVGLLVVREMRRIQRGRFQNVDFKEAYSCGINLLDEVAGYDRVLIVDSIESACIQPGEILEFEMPDFKYAIYNKFVNTHGLNLPTLWELGKKLDIEMPRQCRLFGIASRDCGSFSERLTPELELVFNTMVMRIMEKAMNWLN